MDKKELTEALQAHKEAMDAQVVAIKEASDKEVLALKAELAEMEVKRAALQSQADALDLEFQKQAKSTKNVNGITLEQGFDELIKSDDFKEAFKDGFKSKSTFEVKADTTDITGTIMRTVGTNTVNFAPTDELAFIPGIKTVTIGKDKSFAMWMEGTYTSNVGYVGEGVGQTTGDEGTAEEKTRKMAKVSAKLTLTTEMLNDASLVASLFRNKMQTEAALWLDDEIYSGDGSDGGSSQHIYGIQGHATAFSAASAISAGKVANANIGDLVDAAILQAQVAKQRGLKKVWMNPIDFFRLRTTKDVDGNRIFIKDINGNYTISGLMVVVSNKVTANTMLLADPSKIQLWWKQTPEFKFGQMNGTDIVDDKWTAVMFLRNQIVVEGPDKTALIYVSDITAGIAAINLV